MSIEGCFTNRYVKYAMVAIATCMTGFVLHVLNVSFLQKWIADQPLGIDYVGPVVALAALTSIETGIGLVVLYSLVRRSLKTRSVMVRGLLIALVLLAVNGRFIRQPLMDAVVTKGDWHVLVLDTSSWLVWAAMCIVLVYAYRKLIEQDEPRL